MPPKGTGLTAATRPVATGTAATAQVKVPAVEGVPAALVTMQLRPSVPAVPGVNTRVVPVAPELMVPLVMVQA